MELTHYCHIYITSETLSEHPWAFGWSHIEHDKVLCSSMLLQGIVQIINWNKGTLAHRLQPLLNSRAAKSKQAKCFTGKKYGFYWNVHVNQCLSLGADCVCVKMYIYWLSMGRFGMETSKETRSKAAELLQDHAAGLGVHLSIPWCEMLKLQYPSSILQCYFARPSKLENKQRNLLSIPTPHKSL